MRSNHKKRNLEILENRNLLTTVSSFYSPQPTIDPGDQLSLVASSQDAESIQFYIDNGDGIFNAANDKLVGTDDRADDGWQVTVQTQGPYKIMPLGDSITSARSPRNSYRYPLSQNLEAANYNFDLVGSQTEPGSGLFDSDHEGHWGWRVDQIIEELPNWLQLNVPDVVLLHLGTNDLFQDESISSILAELDQVVVQLRQANPDVVILAAQLLPTRFESNALINQLNAEIPARVEQWNTARSPVVLVDQNSPIDAVEDLYDGVHPRESGEQIMADVWFESIAKVRPLRNPDASFGNGTHTLFAVGTDGDGNVSAPVSANVVIGEPTTQTGILGISPTEQVWVTQESGSSATSTNYGAFPEGDYSHFATGDLNGDGNDDVVGRQTNGRLIVGIANGAGSFQFSDWGGWSNQVTWSEFQVADFNGDGLDDVAGRSNSDGTWWVGESTGASFNNSFWGRHTTAIDWTFATGDFNGDGRHDIAGRAAGDGTWWTSVSSGSGFQNAYWGRWTSGTWSDISVGDFNGDGLDDVAGRLNNTSWNINQSTGTSFTNRYWGSWTRSVDWQDVSVGDFNGDGRDDIAGRGNGQWWIAVSQDSNRFQQQKWGYWTTRTSWHDVRVLDMNNDGKDDIVGRAENGQWWIFESQTDRFAGTKGDRWAPGTNWQLIVGVSFGQGTANGLPASSVGRRRS